MPATLPPARTYSRLARGDCSQSKRSIISDTNSSQASGKFASYAWFGAPGSAVARPCGKSRTRSQLFRTSHRATDLASERERLEGFPRQHQHARRSTQVCDGVCRGVPTTVLSRHWIVHTLADVLRSVFRARLLRHEGHSTCAVGGCESERARAASRPARRRR
jgi:hypothetical protein